MKVRPRHLVFAGVASLVGLSLFLPPVQDYREYLAQWRLVMDGHSPWFDLGENHTNTYGAAHILFAPVAWLACPLPRFLTTLAGIFIGWQLFRSTPEGAPCTIIGHNAGRISKFLSIFRFLRAETLPFGSSLRPLVAAPDSDQPDPIVSQI